MASSSIAFAIGAPANVALAKAPAAATLAPVAASAHHVVSVVASETCSGFTATVTYASLTPDRYISLTSPDGTLISGHVGYSGNGHFTVTGDYPQNGVFTATIYNGKVVESTGKSNVVHIPEGCVKPTPTPTPGACGVPGQKTENVFTRVTPHSGSTVHPGDVVGADYHDESELDTKAPNQLHFTLTGPGGTTTLTTTITNMPPYTGGKTGEFKIVKRITATLPSNPTPGSYTATITGWDTDQTRPGADCGTASWTFSVQPAPQGSLAGDILLCSSGVRVGGGTISASGPQSMSAAANPVSYPQVKPGSYLVSAGAPQGYHFVPCGTGVTIVSPAAATLTVPVTANGSGNAKFFVDANNVAAAAFVPQEEVKAAAVAFMPNTGRGQLLVGAVVGLVLVLMGMTVILAVARNSKRAQVVPVGGRRSAGSSLRE